MTKNQEPEKIRPVLGCVEISLFMKSGFNFYNNDIRTMWLSFGIAALTLPLTLACVPYLYEAQDNLQNLPLKEITLLFALKFVMMLAVMAGFIYMFCKTIGRTDRFVKFITVSNWASLIPLVLFIPPFLFMSLGTQGYEDVYPAIVIISLYSYAITAFIVRYIIDIPWELSVFVTVCLMAINESGFEIINLITA